jgi:hypothetical protein
MEKGLAGTKPSCVVGALRFTPALCLIHTLPFADPWPMAGFYISASKTPSHNWSSTAPSLLKTSLCINGDIVVAIGGCETDISHRRK